MCRRHGSEFDVTTGAVVRGPATQPLNVYEVQVGDGSLRIRPDRVGQSQELRVIWAGFSPGCSRTPYSARAVTHRISRPR